jgi:hypothetical protein
MQRLRENAVNVRAMLEILLAEGGEARSLATTLNPYLLDFEESLATIQGTTQMGRSLQADPEIGQWPQFEAQIGSFMAEMLLLEQELQATRDLLATVLARASQPPPPIDWDRVQAAEEAYARGETKRFAPR